jgi:PAS domain S-box-containing protein
LKIATATGRFEDEGWRLRKDGSRFWANVVITALFDKDRLLRGFLKITRDLTDRKRHEDELLQGRDQLEVRVRERTAELARVNASLQAEIEERKRLFEELRHSEERYRTLLLKMPAAVYTTDRDGRITLFNDQAAALWGRRPEIGKDQWCDSFRIIRPDGTPLPDDECPMAVALREGLSIRSEEILVERPDGVRVWVLPHPEPLRDATGELVGAINMLVDITDRKQAEVKLHEDDRKKDEFLATLGHELRNLLAPIRNALQIMRLNGDSSRTLGQIHEMMERQVRHMGRLVDDLMELSRVTQGKVELRKERISLATVVNNAVETSRPLLTSAGHELTVDLPAEPLEVLVDPTRLAQVIVNLLNNAAKYTEPGGHIWLTAERQGQQAVVRVRDSGVGIAGDMLPHLFEMFTQVERSLRRSQGGLGIGLALVRRFVEMHGGSVQVHSDGPGRGSEFTVRLPLAAEVPARAAPPGTGDGTEPPRLLAKKRVLIVDDDRDSANSLSVLLQLMGHDVRAAHDGLEAVRAAAAFRPDVALLDIEMPKMDGYEAVRHIRGQPWGKDMVLVALTGWGQEEDKQRSLEAGFNYHLTKPLDPTHLQELLASFTSSGGCSCAAPA